MKSLLALVLTAFAAIGGSQVAATTMAAPLEPARAAQATTPFPHLRGVRIALDPGHNPGNRTHPREIARQVDAGPLRKACDTVGAATNAGYSEAAYTTDVVARLATQLRAAGAVVTIVRTTRDAWGPCIDVRARRGNASDLALSVHADGNLGRGNRGFHVIYPTRIAGYTDDILPASKQLAVAVRDAFGAGTGMPRSNYIGHAGLDARGDLGGLDRSDVPKVLVETGNMRSATDAHLLSSRRWRQRAAVALARGLDAYVAAHPTAS
jgi:N-acetylmuramoyl-L-alanine amidase